MNKTINSLIYHFIKSAYSFLKSKIIPLILRIKDITRKKKIKKKDATTTRSFTIPLI